MQLCDWVYWTSDRTRSTCSSWTLYQGARPVPAYSHKAELRLGDHLDSSNRLSRECAIQLRSFVDDALREAEDKGVQQLLAFATSAVRDAVNGDESWPGSRPRRRSTSGSCPGPTNRG